MYPDPRVKFGSVVGCEVLLAAGDYRYPDPGDAPLRIRVTKRLPHLDYTDPAGGWFGVAGMQKCPHTGREVGPRVALLRLAGPPNPCEFSPRR